MESQVIRALLTIAMASESPVPQGCVSLFSSR